MAGSKYNIEKIQQLIPDYIMHSLEPEEMKFVQDAIENSGELRALCEQIKGTLSFVNTIKHEEPEPQYWATLLPRIHEKIEYREGRRFSWQNLAVYWKYALPAAAIILIAVLYFVIFNDQSGPTISEDKNEIKKIDSVMHRGTKVDTKKEIVTEQTDNEEQKIDVSKRRVTKMSDEQITEDKEEEMKEQDEYKEKDEITSAEFEELVRPLAEESVFSGGPGGFDDETEAELDRLSKKEEEILIKELGNSNL